MLYHIAIHTPKPEHTQDVIDSMHRFRDAARTQPGVREIHTLHDARNGTLVGLAIWETAEALAAARPVMAAATEGDDFDAWESGPIQLFLLEEV